MIIITSRFRARDAYRCSYALSMLARKWKLEQATTQTRQASRETEMQYRLESRPYPSYCVGCFRHACLVWYFESVLHAYACDCTRQRSSSRSYVPSTVILSYSLLLVYWWGWHLKQLPVKNPWMFAYATFNTHRSVCRDYYVTTLHTRVKLVDHSWWV